jgi:glutathione S-transferase
VPQLNKLKKWLENNREKIAKHSLTGKAMTYLHNQWEKLIVYCTDGQLSISNIKVENAIRPFAVGRKAWLFSDTPAGVNASATHYSLIETAKLHDLAPYDYLNTIFKALPYPETVEGLRHYYLGILKLGRWLLETVGSLIAYDQSMLIFSIYPNWKSFIFIITLTKSHLARLFFNTKDVEFRNVFFGVSAQNDLIISQANPDHEFPLLLHRDTSIYGINIVTGYTEERYPQQPLMIEAPVGRAIQRMTIFRMNKNLINKIKLLSNTSNEDTNTALKKEIKEEVISWSYELKDTPYFGGEKISIVYIYFIVILWRMKVAGIIFEKEQYDYINTYQDSIFTASYFIESLSERDRDFL